ncbi:hypothetical protein [Ralstonia phage RP13]|nr:hypothetical protein [Ralstonia phage RP13]
MTKHWDRSANPWITDSSMYDPSYYRKALSTNNLWNMDYSLARVFSTPSYCNMLLLDLHGQIETSDLKVKPTEHDFVLDEIPILAASAEAVLESIVDAINGSKSSARDKELALKGVAWYFAMSPNLVADLPPELEADYSILIEKAQARNERVMFYDLQDLVGTRFSAEKAKRLATEVLKQHMDIHEA